MYCQSAVQGAVEFDSEGLRTSAGLGLTAMKQRCMRFLVNINTGLKGQHRRSLQTLPVFMLHVGLS